MHNFWNFFLKNRQFSYIILIALIFFGVFSMLSIPRESAPEVRIPIAVITTVFPGAAAVDVEELVTNEIEDQLEGVLDNVKKITSTSREGVSSVVVEFEADADLDKSIQDVKDEVDKVKPNLPSDAKDPSVTDVNFADEPVMSISLLTDLPVTQIIKLTESLESEIKGISGVSKVQISGVPEREVQVVVNQEALSNFKVKLTDVVRAIEVSNASLPAGVIELDNFQYNVAFEGSIKNPNEIGDIAILNQFGEPIYVRDIAFVSDGVSGLSTLARVSIDSKPSEPAVSLSVFKRSGGDVTRLSDDVKEKLSELEDSLLKNTPYVISFDNGKYVKDDLKNLSTTAIQTIILVMIILFFAIGWKEALIAGLAIPLSFLVAFIGLNSSGNTINFISLFSLILSVGILVDSAIVVTEAIHTKMKEHQDEDKEVAAVNTIKEFHYPLTTGTLTTIAVFAPLFLVTGVSGQFIATIPFTIIFVLIASLFVALAFVPLIASKILTRRSKSKMEEKQEAITNKFQNWYREFLEKFLSNKKSQNKFLILIILTFFVVLSFPFTGIVKVIFFDQEDIEYLFIEVEKPQGTVLEQTDLSAREIEEIILGHEGIDSYIVEVGRGSQFGGNGGAEEKIANITLVLDENRKKTSSEILEDLRAKLAPINSASVRVFQPNDGPPTGAPIIVKFFGNDLNNISEAIDTAENILKDIPGAVEVNTSTKSDSTEFSLVINRGKASQFGLDPSIVAFTLRTALFGTDATTIKSNGENIDVVVKLDINQDFTTPDTTNKTTIDAVENIEIITVNGPVLLGSIVDTSLKRSNELIDHEDREKIGSVFAEIEKGANTREIISTFEKRMKEEAELREGVRMKIGGETEESTQAFKEMGISLIVGIIGILAILVLQFSSYRYAFYIVAIVPLSLIGVFSGLAISGKALSFPSMMGFIALSGIVVNNSIILIDRMNQLRKEKVNKDVVTSDEDLKKIVIEGSVSRLRPIILTTITTVIGVIPLTYASDLWSPLAFAIVFGLSFAVVVTLILVPMLYFRWPGKMK